MNGTRDFTPVTIISLTVPPKTARLARKSRFQRFEDDLTREGKKRPVDTEWSLCVIHSASGSNRNKNRDSVTLDTQRFIHWRNRDRQHGPVYG